MFWQPSANIWLNVPSSTAPVFFLSFDDEGTLADGYNRVVESKMVILYRPPIHPGDTVEVELWMDTVRGKKTPVARFDNITQGTGVQPVPYPFPRRGQAFRVPKGQAAFWGVGGTNPEFVPPRFGNLVFDWARFSLSGSSSNLVLLAGDVPAHSERVNVLMNMRNRVTVGPVGIEASVPRYDGYPGTVPPDGYPAQVIRCKYSGPSQGYYANYGATPGAPSGTPVMYPIP